MNLSGSNGRPAKRLFGRIALARTRLVIHRADLVCDQDHLIGGSRKWICGWQWGSIEGSSAGIGNPHHLGPKLIAAFSNLSLVEPFRAFEVVRALSQMVLIEGGEKCQKTWEDQEGTTELQANCKLIRFWNTSGAGSITLFFHNSDICCGAAAWIVSCCLAHEPRTMNLCLLTLSGSDWFGDLLGGNWGSIKTHKAQLLPKVRHSFWTRPTLH